MPGVAKAEAEMAAKQESLNKEAEEADAARAAADAASAAVEEAKASGDAAALAAAEEEAAEARKVCVSCQNQKPETMLVMKPLLSSGSCEGRSRSVCPECRRGRRGLRDTLQLGDF